MNYFTHYANAGFSVLPIKTDGSKSPAVGSWSQFQLQAAEPALLEEWHTRGHGVALIGGRVSGGLEIIDIDDPALVRPYFDALREADANLLHRVAFVATPRRDPETGKSGVHILFRSDEPVGNQKLAMSEPRPQFDADGNQLLNPVTGEPISRAETLIETRGEGGYVLTVGCPAECHPSGNLYEHKYGCQIAELTKLTHEQRGLLLQVASQFDRTVIEHHEPTAYESYSEAPGNRFAATTSWEAILEPHGWTKAGASAGTQRWTRPGKSKGWSATTGLTSTHGNELFCVFSSNAHPFPGPTAGASCSTHSKFDAYARLNFGGDHSAAARHLAGDGVGRLPAQPDKPKPIVFETWDRVARQYIEQIEAGGGHTIELPLPSLDDAVGGFGFGEVVVIAGRPSHGKTMVALQFADYFSQCQHSSLLLSEEMSYPMLGKRRLNLACDLNEDLWRAQTEKLKAEYAEYMSQPRAPVYIAPQSGSVKRAVEVIEKAATEHGIKIIVVDYAQLLRGKGNTRYEQVTDVSQQIREVTSRHGLLTLLLCQLNRASEKTENRPRSTDLRDSGQLEQDADVVLLVDWPYRRGEHESNQLQWDDYFIYIDKNRNRETRQTKVQFKIEPRRQMLKEMPHEWVPTMDYSEVTGGEY